MHYRSMLFVELPAVQKDEQWEQQVQERMEEVKAQHPGKIAEKVLLEVTLGMLSNIRTTFGRELTEVIHKTMARFVYETDDPELLEFEDRTDEYLAGFNQNIVCVSMPDGRILAADDYAFMRDFKIQDGKVFQKKDCRLTASHWQTSTICGSNSQVHVVDDKRKRRLFSGVCKCEQNRVRYMQDSHSDV